MGRHKVKRPLRSTPDQSGDAISVKQAGARGGRSTLERRGVEFFRQIGRKGGQRRAELYRELLTQFGQKGGRPRRPALGKSAGEENH